MKANYIQVFNSGSINVESRKVNDHYYHYVVRVDGSVQVSFTSAKLPLTFVLERAYMLHYYENFGGANYWKKAVPSAIADALRAISTTHLVGEVYLDTFKRLMVHGKGRLTVPNTTQEISNLVDHADVDFTASVLSFELTTDHFYRVNQHLTVEFSFGEESFRPTKTVTLSRIVPDGSNPFNYQEIAQAMRAEVNNTFRDINA